MGILEALLSGDNNPNVGQVQFNSTKHTRFQGAEVTAEAVCNRQVQIEKNVNGQKGYTVTIFNTDENHPIWGSNVQMSAKPMEIVSYSPQRVELRGYGYDQTALSLGVPKEGASFACYGLEVLFSQNKEVVKCNLLLHDRNVRIEYM